MSDTNETNPDASAGDAVAVSVTAWPYIETFDEDASANESGSCARKRLTVEVSPSDVLTASRSNRPSPLKSPAMSEDTSLGERYRPDGWNVPSPFPEKIRMLYVNIPDRSAVVPIAISGLPSPSKSSTEIGPRRTSRSDDHPSRSVPSPLPGKTTIFPVYTPTVKLDVSTIRSGFPSPSTSTISIAGTCGAKPLIGSAIIRLESVWNVPSPLPRATYA